MKNTVNTLFIIVLMLSLFNVTSCSNSRKRLFQLSERGIHLAIQSRLSAIKYCYSDVKFVEFVHKEQHLIVTKKHSDKVNFSFQRASENQSFLGQCILDKLDGLEFSSSQDILKEHQFMFPVNFSIKSK